MKKLWRNAKDANITQTQLMRSIFISIDRNIEAAYCLYFFSWVYAFAPTKIEAQML